MANIRLSHGTGSKIIKLRTEIDFKPKMNLAERKKMQLSVNENVIVPNDAPQNSIRDFAY